MWNDTDIPLAYFISFRGYGTWLHGDARGSTDRYHNLYGTPHLPQIDDWHKHNEDQLKSEPVRLDASRRLAIRNAIHECLEKRGWRLLAMNIRSNHVHTVVDIGAKKVGLALNALKANATRHLREKDLWPYEHSPWARKGSRGYLWTKKHVACAIDYVLIGQGDDLPDFD